MQKAATESEGQGCELTGGKRGVRDKRRVVWGKKGRQGLCSVHTTPEKEQRAFARPESFLYTSTITQSCKCSPLQPKGVVAWGGGRVG
jgi:hypothetical protein